MTRLADWEKRLTPFFNQQLQILAEIPLSEMELDEILDLVRDEISKLTFLTFPKISRVLKEIYPRTFLTMLAHFAAHNDQQGYWNTLAARLGSDLIPASNWRQVFVNLAREFGLHTFTLKDTAHYYVATIRFHGGIPTYSLPDFFERMVKPAVTRTEYRETPPRELLPCLIKKSVFFVGKPVLDFLENSGEMGVSWFEESCQLLRHAEKNFGEVLPRAKVPTLPLYVYQFFEKYNEGVEEDRHHWRRPFLQVAPYEEDTAVVLVLAQQTVPPEFYNQGLVWKISWPGLEQPLFRDCQMKRLGRQYVTEEDYLPVIEMPEMITVSILSAPADQASPSEEIRRWAIPMMPDGLQAKFLAFRENQRHITNPQTLPEKPVYLLMPGNYELEIDGAGQRTATFPAYGGHWKEWKLEGWDLFNTQAISLLKDGVPVGEKIPVAKEVVQPDLVGGHLFYYQENLDEPLYTSSIPCVQFPVRIGLDKYRALQGWTVHISTLSEALPEINKTFSLLSLQRNVEVIGDMAQLPLREVLGEKPAGIYDIKIRGPKGLGSDHRIRLWPQLLIKGLPTAFPKPEDAHKDVQFEVHLQEGAWLNNQSGEVEVEIIEVDGVYLIKAPPEVYSVRLDLKTQTSQEKIVRIPVSIPLARLRWAIAEERAPGSLAFGQEPLHISIGRFDQYKTSALYFEMHGLESMVSKLKLQLVKVGIENRVLESSELTQLSFIHDRLRVPLRKFSTTILIENTLMQFELVYQKDRQSEPIRYPVLTLSPQMGVQDVELHPEGEVSWRLTWNEEKPLEHRRVMLQSLWQPWQPTIEIKIPNDAVGEALITDISLPPAQYAVYFYVLNPWSKPLTEPPQGIEPHLVALRSPEDRLRELAYDGDDHDIHFQSSIESACIYNLLDEKKKRDEAVSVAAKHLRYLKNIKPLIASIKWMQDKDIAPAYKSFLMTNMFHPEIVDTVLSKYRNTDPVLHEYLHMVGAPKSIHLTSARYLLEKIDDPMVISACVNELIRKKDGNLISTIVNLVEEERLEIEDAASYLLKLPDDRMNIIKELDGFSWSPPTEQLIMEYLHQVYEEIGDKSDEAVKSAMLRAAWYEISQERMYQYLDYLLRIQWDPDEIYELMIDRHLAGILGDPYLVKLLEIDPKKSISFLKKADDSFYEYQELLDDFERRFPQASGVVRTGLNIKAPFGDATINRIILQDGTSVQEARIGKIGLVLEVASGKGLDEVRAKIDFEEMQITFLGVESVWRCGCCKSFYHPDQNILQKHHFYEHSGEIRSMSKESPVIPFVEGDIQFVNPE